MLYYFLTLFLSTVALYYSENSKKKALKAVLCFAGIVIPCVLSGLRADSVGTDVSVYGLIDFYTALGASSFKEYRSVFIHQEPGFLLINYIFSRVFRTHHIVFFTYQLIIDTCAYIAFCKLSRKWHFHVYLAMLFFYFALYNRSLNIMRQCIAVGFTFLGLSYLIVNHSYAVFIFCVAVGMLFHKTAALALAYIPLELCFSLEFNQNSNDKIRHVIVLCALIATTVILGPAITRLLVETGIMNPHYLDYLPGNSMSTISSDVNPLYLCFAVPEIFYGVIIIPNFFGFITSNKTIFNL